MEDVKTTYKFSIITCLMSLDKNNENYENKKNKILELLKQVEDIKTKDELINFRKKTMDKLYEKMYKDLTKEEGKNTNYIDLLFKNLIDIHFFNTEYNVNQLNYGLTLIKMLNILEERKKIILYNLTHPFDNQYKDKDLNEYLEEYSKLYKKFMDTEKYNFEKHYRYKKHYEDKLVKLYKQNNEITYNDFYDIIEK